MKFINGKKSCLPTRQGFTLVELLLVMAIIGILASIIFISIGSARKRARITTFKESMKNIAVAATQCTDIGGTIAPGAGGALADGSQPLCTAGNIGNIPTIRQCDGTSGNVTITAPVNAGDDFQIQSVCTVNTSSGANCTATCTANGCVFDDTNDPDANDNCPNT